MCAGHQKKARVRARREEWEKGIDCCNRHLLCLLVLLYLLRDRHLLYVDVQTASTGMGLAYVHHVQPVKRVNRQTTPYPAPIVRPESTKTTPGSGCAIAVQIRTTKKATHQHPTRYVSASLATHVWAAITSFEQMATVQIQF